MSLQKNNDITELPAPKIFIPYPQTLDPKEFLPKPNSRKTCNGFMIYRKVYQKQLNANAHKFKMTMISRWASALWLKENEKLKDAYRQFASKIAKLHLENHQAELEALSNRINTVRLLAAPYIFRSQQFVSPSISSVSLQYNYVNESFPSVDLCLDDQQLCIQNQTTPNYFYEDQQSVNYSPLTAPVSNYFDNTENLCYNETPSYALQTSPQNSNSFFDDSF